MFFNPGPGPGRACHLQPGERLAHANSRLFAGTAPQQHDPLHRIHLRHQLGREQRRVRHRPVRQMHACGSVLAHPAQVLKQDFGEKRHKRRA